MAAVKVFAVATTGHRAVSLSGTILAASLMLWLGAPSCIIQHGPGAPASASASLAVVSPSPTQATPLRTAAQAAHRRIGTALMSGRLDSARVRALVALNFDSLTPENEMKWQTVEPRPGAFSFAAADRLVAFAAEHHMRMRGHTLVWHSQLPPWVKDLTGGELRAAMARHVRGVVGHYRGRVAAWDVVNEALADGPGGGLRADSPFTALGPTFIDEAFRVAHEVDPDAQLFYNDYEIEGEGTAKADAAFALCRRLKDSGVPITGVGFQMHLDPRHMPSADSVRRNMARFAELGLQVEITEMDVPVGEIPGGMDDKRQRQRRIAHDIVAACVAVERCAAVTFWGLTDADSWLEDPHWGALRGRGPHHALLFDDAYQPKPVVLGVVDALEGR